MMLAKRNLLKSFLLARYRHQSPFSRILADYGTQTLPEDDAIWNGAYRYAGRVRLADGLIVLKRQPVRQPAFPFRRRG